MRKKSKHSNSDDTALFRDAIGEVRPVKGGRNLPDKPRPKPEPKFSQADDRAVIDELLTAETDLPDIETGEELQYFRPHLSRKVMRQLRRGSFAIQDEIDLHRMTREQARTALRSFIHECGARGMTCVRVIHGKGLSSGPQGPVLKAAVNSWLRRWDEVTAFCSARPWHGGTGAVYVLLKK
jgi:DNA-nicking Smr family endonuclease